MPDSTQQHSGDDISRIVRGRKDMSGALLPILHAIQEDLGHIPADAVPVIAFELNLTRAEVHGVVSFYRDFRSERPGRHLVNVCQAESCQAMGSANLTAAAKEHLGVDFNQTTADQAFTLEAVYCLGNCACSPSVMLDGELFGRVSPERFRELIDEARQTK